MQRDRRCGPAGLPGPHAELRPDRAATGPHRHHPAAAAGAAGDAVHPGYAGLRRRGLRGAGPAHRRAGRPARPRRDRGRGRERAGLHRHRGRQGRPGARRCPGVQRQRPPLDGRDRRHRSQRHHPEQPHHRRHLLHRRSGRCRRVRLPLRTQPGAVQRHARQARDVGGRADGDRGRERRHQRQPVPRQHGRAARAGRLPPLHRHRQPDRVRRTQAPSPGCSCTPGR